MPPPSKGYFYRRHAGRHYPADDPRARDYELYWCIQAYGKRIAVCMHTTSLRTARARARRFPRGIELNSQQRFWKALARAGRQAQRHLDQSIDKPITTESKP